MRFLYLATVLVMFPLATEGQVMVEMEFQVNTYTTDDQRRASVSHAGDGSFVVVWDSRIQDGSGYSIEGQQFDSAGAPKGSEFQVNTYTTGNQNYPSVSHAYDGSFVVVWHSNHQDGSGYGIEGQRYDSTGEPTGGEFQINSYTEYFRMHPHLSHSGDGSFVVVWQGTFGDYSDRNIQGQRYDSAGAPTGGEFRVNSYTTFSQSYPSISHGIDGSFAIVWDSWNQDGSEHGVEGQRYSSNGASTGGEFQINSYTTNKQKKPRVSHGID